MNIRTANITDIEKILLLKKQVFDLHLEARSDWIGKNPISYDHTKILLKAIMEKYLLQKMKI